MTANQLRITFKPPDDTAGISLEDVETTLHHLRMAVRETVWSFGDNDSKARTRPPGWVVEQSALKVFSASPGSLVIDLGLPDRKEQPESSEPDYGPQALKALLNWEGPGDPALPGSAVKHLESIETGLSPDVTQVLLTDWDDRGEVTIHRKERSRAPRKWHRQFEPARAHGMLMEVNWQRRTAELHPTRPFPGERHVPLHFEARLSDVMLQNAMRFVTVAGKARFTESDEYEVFHVEEVIPSRGSKPFTSEEFEETLSNARAFRHEELVRCSEPFDVEDFIRVIYQARDV